MKDATQYQSMKQHHELTTCVSQYTGLVKRIALHIKKMLPYRFELDDIIQAGFLGLLEAKASYNEHFGAAFQTYAAIKIRYAIYESLRKDSGVTREISQKLKRISQAIGQLENKQIVTATSVADVLGITTEQYHRDLTSINAVKTVPLDDLTHEIPSADDSLSNPVLETARLQIKSMIKKLIEELPKKEQLVLALYYNECLGFREIGEILALSEARISQIHAQLMKKLRLKLVNLQDAMT